ncbi:Multidrug-efflux transporter MexB [Kluyvera cryocrescens]|uniref:Multidrug-efflux transporter MexB n=1 Tax=Kluyvera cryocrescens TaxID=580 RepID=A0A485ALS5_KLUCR|nr:Multidrug-efflux transporter MexB [Kluyvera cryocrescens]
MPRAIPSPVPPLRAAQTRLRPIIMTSLAFVAGGHALAVATGAGANSRIAIGTGIIGGTLTATLLAIFFGSTLLCAGETSVRR